jgi:hypothetical protein
LCDPMVCQSVIRVEAIRGNYFKGAGRYFLKSFLPDTPGLLVPELT